MAHGPRENLTTFVMLLSGWDVMSGFIEGEERTHATFSPERIVAGEAQCE